MSGFSRPSIYDLNKTQYNTFIQGAKSERTLQAEREQLEKKTKQQLTDKETNEALAFGISKFGGSIHGSKGRKGHGRGGKDSGGGKDRDNHSKPTDRSAKKKAALASFLKDVKHVYNACKTYTHLCIKYIHETQTHIRLVLT